MGGFRVRLSAFLLAVLLPISAQADKAGWSGFYTASVSAVKPAALSTNQNPMRICIEEILAAEQRYDIPGNLPLAIGIQEAGREVNNKLVVWPWTANTNGTGTFFGSKLALEAHVRETQARGVRSTDVGCMQINQRWHGDQFASLEEATAPVHNVDYAARFLTSLYHETGDWWQAAGRYHSSNASYKAVYLKKLKQNQRIAQAFLTRFASDVSAGDNAPQQVAAARDMPDFNWSADLSGANSGKTRGALSIYSTQVLTPVLPHYAEVN